MEQRHPPGQVVKHQQGARGRVTGAGLIIPGNRIVGKLFQFMDQVKIGVAHQAALERDLIHLGG